MSEIRRGARASDNFAQIANAALADQRLSYRARGILAYLLSLPPGWETTSEKVAAAGTEGRDAVRTALRELERFGYLVRNQDRDEKGRQGSASYEVFDQPVDNSVDGFPGDGPGDGFPGDGSPVGGFPGPSSKKKTKKETNTTTRVEPPASSSSYPQGEAVTSPAREAELPPPQPLSRPDHCVAHQDDLDPPPCPGCAEARRTMQYVREQMIARPCPTHGHVGKCPYCPGGRFYELEEIA